MKIFCGLFLILVATTCFAQQRQVMRPQDILRVANVTDAQISPNGQWVVYTRLSVEEDKSLARCGLHASRLEAYSIPMPTPTPRRPVPYVDWPEIRADASPFIACRLERFDTALVS